VASRGREAAKDGSLKPCVFAPSRWWKGLGESRSREAAKDGLPVKPSSSSRLRGDGVSWAHTRSREGGCRSLLPFRAFGSGGVSGPHAKPRSREGWSAGEAVLRAAPSRAIA
jgi:hypothetical protein